MNAIIRGLEQAEFKQKEGVKESTGTKIVTFYSSTHSDYIYYYYNGTDKLFSFKPYTCVNKHSFLFIVKGFVAGNWG